jgi:fatty-acyl-CoA synthase
MIEPARTVGELVRMGARRWPQRVAVAMAQGASVSYAELDERTDRLAGALIQTGLVPGDRIAAWMEDGVPYVELYIAAAKASLVMVPVNARLRAVEAQQLLLDAEPQALFWTPAVAGELDALGRLAANWLTVSTAPDHRAAFEFEQLVQDGEPRVHPEPGPDDLYIIGYTSGTTGSPKGAMLTHRGVLAIARLNAHSYRLPPHSVAALTGSMSFVATVPAHIVSHLWVGGTCIIMGRWDVATLLRTIAARGVTFTYIPSPLLADFTAAAERDPAAWSTLRSVLHSASRADPDKLAALCAVVGDRFVEGLGMTENSGGLVTATTAADIRGHGDARDIFASVGRAVIESEVRIVDDAGADVAHDGRTIGELVIRSPAVMAGYWRRPAETAAALRDGWYHTGDLAAIDEAGYVYMSDRRTDLIVSGGMNVYPSEVEQCIAELPKIAECAVVGLPHERWGLTVVAAVVPVLGATIDPQSVIDHCAGRLAGFKKPTAVTVLEELPRTTSLKIRRGEVRDLLEAQLVDQHAGLSTKRLV